MSLEDAHPRPDPGRRPAHRRGVPQIPSAGLSPERRFLGRGHAGGARSVPGPFRLPVGATAQRPRLGRTRSSRPRTCGSWPATCRSRRPCARAVPSGTSFWRGKARTPHVVLAIRYQGRIDEEPRVIAAAVSLRRIADHLAPLSSVDSDIVLLDRQGRSVVSGRPGMTALEPKVLPHGKPGLLPEANFVTEYESHGHPVIGAYVPIPVFGLGVVVERWVQSALAPARRLTWTTIYWVGVAAFVAAVVGAALARSLAVRVGTLVQGARQIAKGKLDSDIEVASNDELGELAKAFNSMASSLAAARARDLFADRRNPEAGTSPWKDGSRKRPKSCATPRTCFCAHARWPPSAPWARAWPTKSTTRSPASSASPSSCLSDLPADHPSRPLVQDIEEQAVRISRDRGQPAALFAEAIGGAPATHGSVAGGPRRARTVRAQGAGRCRYFRGDARASA